MSQPAVAITGRFQPFHLDHLELVTQGLAIGGQVIIGVNNPDQRSWQAVGSSPHRHKPSANPFTFWERLQMITAALLAAGVTADRFQVVPFPLDQPNSWFGYIPKTTKQWVRVYSAWEVDKVGALRDGGYGVEVIQGDPGAKISASDVRAAMVAGRPWQHWLPDAVTKILDAFGDDELRRRCT